MIALIKHFKLKLRYLQGIIIQVKLFWVSKKAKYLN